jgi:hypothetical protein
MFVGMGTVVLRVFIVVLVLAAGLVARVTYEQVVNRSRSAWAQADLYDCIDFRIQEVAQDDFDQNPSDPYGLG